MRIKWTDGQKEVPGIGILCEGNEYTVPDEIGKALVKQKQAQKITENNFGTSLKKKTTKTEASE